MDHGKLPIKLADLPITHGDFSAGGLQWDIRGNTNTYEH